PLFGANRPPHPWRVRLATPLRRWLTVHTGAVAVFDDLAGTRFGTVLAAPPWRFQNRTGKVAPEHRRLSRYDTMTWKEIAALPVADLALGQSHCYLWAPNALVPEGLQVLQEWGFTYKTMLIWHK